MLVACSLERDPILFESGAPGGSGGAGGSQTLMDTAGAEAGGLAETAGNAGDTIIADAGPSDEPDAALDASPALEPDPIFDAGPMDYGGVGELLLVPLVYTNVPVPPIVEMDCEEDPTEGYTEYKDSFVVQRPRNLPAADRFKYENGIYTAWIFPGDQPHKPNNNTRPRTETRFSDLGTGEHIMSVDVMVDPVSDGTVVHQFKSAGTKGGNIGTYLQVSGGDMKDRAGSVASDILGKWINIKVAFDIPSGVGRIWLNNCLKVTTQREKNALWYFKFGTYHCDHSEVCRANFKNVHLYHKGSTDKFNVKSPIP